MITTMLLSQMRHSDTRLARSDNCFPNCSETEKANLWSWATCTVYKEVVQSVLLFGFETWNLTPTIMKRVLIGTKLNIFYILYNTKNVKM